MSLLTAPTTRPPARSRTNHPQPVVSSRLCRSDSGEIVRLRDGAPLLVRPIRPTDADLLTDGFSRLSARSRWFRFLGAKKELSPSDLQLLTNVDHLDHEALIAIDVADGRGVGVARYVRAPDDPSTAEIAVTVVDDWHRRGVGTVLLERLNDRARRAGIGRYAVLVSTENVASLRLLRGLGFDPAAAIESSGMLEGHIALSVTVRGSLLAQT